MVRGRVTLSLVLVLSLLASLRVAVSAGHNYDSASVDTPVTVPAAIAVPATGYELQVVVFAKGYQYYRFNGSSWVNYNASAVLYHKKPKKATKLAAIGRHFYLTQPDALGGQPTWETLPEDGVPFSLVTGKAVARVTVDPNSIAWVLLNATNSEGDRYVNSVLAPFLCTFLCDICCPVQWSGRFLGITSSDPSVCNSNRLHVDIVRFSCIKLGYILQIPLKWSVMFLQSWASTVYSQKLDRFICNKLPFLRDHSSCLHMDVNVL